MTCADREDSGKPGRPPSLIRYLAVRLKKPLVLSYPLSARQRLTIGRMPRLICVFAERTCHFVGFLMLQLKSYPTNDTNTKGKQRFMQYLRLEDDPLSLLDRGNHNAECDGPAFYIKLLMSITWKRCFRYIIECLVRHLCCTFIKW